MQSSAKLTGAFSIVESLVAIWSVHSFSALINMGHAQLQSPGSRCVEQAARREGGRRTGASENLALRSPLGRPRWLQSTTRLPASCRCLMVGKASSRRVVSVISPVFLSCTVRGREVHAQVQQRGRDNLRRASARTWGTLKSTRTSTRLLASMVAGTSASEAWATNTYQVRRRATAPIAGSDAAIFCRRTTVHA